MSVLMNVAATEDDVLSRLRRLGYCPGRWIDLLPNADVVSSSGTVDRVDDVLSTELDSEQ